MKLLLIGFVFALMYATAQPEQPICDDNGDCIGRSVTQTIRHNLTPRLLVR